MRKGRRGLYRGAAPFLAAALMLVGLAPAVAQDGTSAAAEKTAAEALAELRARRADTLRYGIESQVIELLQTLRSERERYFDDMVLELAREEGGHRMRAAALEYFGHFDSDRAEGVASAILRERERHPNALALAGFSYLTRIKSRAALSVVDEVLADDERPYLQAAIRLAAAAGASDRAEAVARVFENEATGSGLRIEALNALGTLKAPAAFDLLSRVLGDEAGSKAERMNAARALAALGDERAVAGLAAATRGEDPNVRASAVEALGSFKGQAAASAVVAALRDSHQGVRAAAVKAAGGMKLAEAIPALEFRLRQDPDRPVREAAIGALAAFDTAGTWSTLVSFVEDDKQPQQYRLRAFAAVIGDGPTPARSSMRTLFASMDTDKDRATYLAFARAALGVDKEGAADFALRLYGDKEFTSRLAAIAWAERNAHAAHLPELRRLAESDPTESVRRRAGTAVERIAQAR